MGRRRRWWRRDFFLDLGATTILFAAAGDPAFRSEASLLILRRGLASPYAAGDAVRHLIGRLPPSYRLARPYRGNQLQDADLLEKLLGALIGEKLQAGWRRRHVWLTLSMASSPAERQAAVRVLHNLGASRVHLTAEPYVVALGSGGLDEPGRVTAVINVGGESTELAILNRDAMVAAQAIPMGGRALDEAVREWALNRLGVEVSPLMAEEAKFRLGDLRPAPGTEVDPIPVAGKNLKTGLPSRVQVDPERLRAHVAEQVRVLAAAFARLLEGCSAEVAADVLERGVVLVGGGARLKGFDQILGEALKLPIRTEPKPDAFLLEGFHRWLAQPAIIPAEGVRRPKREREKGIFPGIPGSDGVWYPEEAMDFPDEPLGEVAGGLDEAAAVRAEEGHDGVLGAPELPERSSRPPA
ncbi:MAG TPA: rod shape-determining protein [Limnochorda sp.]